MSPDLRPGPDSPPTDELSGAEAALTVLQKAVHAIAGGDLSRQTPCTEFDVAQLTDHLLDSIRAIGDMADADFSLNPDTDSVEVRVISAARPALDAWHRRGLDGRVPVGPNIMPARTAAGVLSVEFLVHAWDYSKSMGHEIDAADSLVEYVLGLARELIRPEERSRAGFDDPVEVPDEASALDQLIAFTGRNPAR
jgi:uncharacterized protein (TIGR03086 family)